MQELMYQGMGGFGYLVSILIAVIVVIPFWKLCARAGFSPWLGVLVLIPVANLVFVYFLAFSPWPSQKSS